MFSFNVFTVLLISPLYCFGSGVVTFDLTLAAPYTSGLRFLYPQLFVDVDCELLDCHGIDTVVSDNAAMYDL